MSFKSFGSWLACGLVVIGCGKKKGGFDELPALAPIVQQSLPASLKATGSSFLGTDDFAVLSLGSSNIEALFKTGTYNTISGGSYKGLVNALLRDLDSRFDELSGRFEEAPDCFSNTAQSHEFDFSAAADSSVASTVKISMDLQCLDLFTGSGDQSGTGSGLLFGKSESNYSLALLLNEKNVANSGFGYFAKVANRGETNEEVNLIFAEARPSGSTTGQLSSLTRVRALPNSGVFEIAMAASTPTRSNPFNNTPAKVGLGCGFHAVTNGTVVFVKGIDHSTGPDTCSGAYSTTLCLNASNLSSASAGSCDSIRDNMTIGTTANLTNWDYSDTSTSVGTSLFNAMQINGSVIQGKTSSVD